MAEQLVDAATAAHQLGTTRSSLYRLAKAGKIPSYACGPRLSGVRFDLAEVREVLRRPVTTAQPSSATTEEEGA